LGHLQTSRRPRLAGEEGRARNNSLLFQADRGVGSEAEHGTRRGRKDKLHPAAAYLYVVPREPDRGHSEFAPPSAAEAPWRASDAAETIVTNSGVAVRIGGDRAYYALGTDHIQMPPRHVFASAEGWCSTVLHELGHATGHPSRLNRDLRNSFGSPDYAREELRAEIAQVMVCAELGIGECEFTNGAAYIASWLETLRSDRKEIFRAAADAQRIADYLLALHPDYAARHLDTMISTEDAAAATSEPQANSASAAK
jgi:antirestriction protein ArdC